MMSSQRITLSILTPAVPSRWRQLEWLCSKIQRQIGDKPVEHLVLLDNKRRTVGEKRDALLRAAQGEYIAFVDDDDDIADDYVDEILRAAQFKAQVITFCQKATVNGASAVIQFKLGNPNEPFVGNAHGDGLPPPPRRGRETQRDEGEPSSPVVKRNAWHICAWRRELAIGSNFPAINYGEDWAFAAPLCEIAETQTHIPKILHYYRHSTETTEAPSPFANDEFRKVTGS